MQLGFVLDQTKCIGCHACTVACKQENDVPLGDFRTWVKYVESGTFPDVERSFAVMRCNQCSRAPCVAVCPTGALHKRPDGIVDLNHEVCVGCRACMQACPYEALHLDEARGVAAKCHFCAHRVEQGMAPACAAVCPVEAIQVVDLSNSADRFTQLVRAGKTTVRRPEKRTGPNVHYIGASPTALRPDAAHRDSAWIWSERTKGREEVVGVGPAEARVVMEPVHSVPWGWLVPAFLLIKGTEAGFAAFAPFASVASWVPPLIGVVGTMIVALLMIVDLHRPERFYMLLTRGNPGSWLVRGAWILLLYSALQTAALASAFTGAESIATAIEWMAVAFCPLVAGYSAALFAQCEGRDLWRSPLVLPRLLVQAAAGGASLGVALGERAFAPWAVAGFVAYFALALAFRRGDAQPAHFLRSARPWGLHPLVMLGVGAALAAAGAVVPLLALLAIATLFVEDIAWVRSGQLPSNS